MMMMMNVEKEYHEGLSMNREIGNIALRQIANYTHRDVIIVKPPVRDILMIISFIHKSSSYLHRL